LLPIRENRAGRLWPQFAAGMAIWWSAQARLRPTKKRPAKAASSFRCRIPQ
jgi:hypothetical protein